MTLVVLNTVPEAQGIFRQIKDALARVSSRPEVVLLHGRFRPVDRRLQMDRLLAFVSKQDASEDGRVDGDPGIVVVSTQVVEAGIDISGVKLWSQVAPWASDIQRLGRLNREGKQPEAAAEFWMPKDDREGENNPSSPNAKRIGPYFKKDLDAALKLLKEVQKGVESGQTYRDVLDKVLASEASRQALEVEYEAVIRPHDFLELFATEPDLSGALRTFRGLFGTRTATSIPTSTGGRHADQRKVKRFLLQTSCARFRFTPWNNSSDAPKTRHPSGTVSLGVGRFVGSARSLPTFGPG